MLQVQNINKSFGSYQALHNVSLQVRRGTIFGLLGPNGAGKTTLIRIINGIINADSGTLLFNGNPITEANNALIGYLPEERGLYKKMPIAEQAIYLAQLKGISKQDAEQRLSQWMSHFGIESWRNRKVEQLSKGMQQKVQFIVTLLHNPQLVILDEPFSGFDPVNAALLKEEILRLKAEGRTIILSSHNLNSVEELCDDIALLRQSELILSGNLKEIQQQHHKSLNDLFIDLVK